VRSTKDSLQNRRAPKERNGAESSRGEEHLEGAQSEGELEEALQALDGELKALLEEQEEDANLPQRVEVREILEALEAIGAKDNTCGEEAKDGREIELLAYGNDGYGGCEEYDGILTEAIEGLEG